MKRKLIFCTTIVNASNIRRESRDGVEHIIITSFTLPPDIVMNRGLYPAEEVAKSFKTLERTLAPIEHPEVNGQFMSASDPFAINNFYGGAWNENVEKIEDGRIKVDKVINVQEALKSEKGKRLLDRVAGLEDGSDTRPMHTSVGVFLDPDLLDEPQTNALGDEYDWIAKDLFFDHDAILLDSIGAATPSKGVGIGINKEKVDVEFVGYDNDAYTPVIKLITYDMRINEHTDLSFDQINEKLWDALNRGITDFDKKSWIVAVFDDTFVFETPSGEMFRSGYTIDANGNLGIQDTRLPVERVVEYRPINPLNEDEDTTMRDKIIAELKKLGVTVNADISDDDLKAEYDKAMLAANAGSDDGDNQEADAEMALTVKKQAEQISTLQANAEKRDKEELADKIKQIQTNSKYATLSDDVLTAIHATNAEEFETMYTDSIPSYGIGSTNHSDSGEDDKFTINTKADDLPE